MTFESDLEQMKEIYEDTERQFIEFTRIIPIDNPYETYSTRLYSLLQHICGQIESLMRIYCDQMNLKYDSRKFPSYFETLNSNKMLENQKILLIKTKSIIQPFLPKGISTEWWHNYNDTKHQLPNGLKQGNLGNTILALAGLYLLHTMKKYLQWEMPPEKLLDHRHWQNEDEKISDKLLIHHLRTSEGISKIFYNLTHYFGNEQGLK